MTLFDRDNLRVLVGVGIGVGGTVLVPVILPAAVVAFRPFVKTLLKQSVLTAERSREHIAVLAESVEDLLAEVKGELETELAQKSAVSAATPASAGNGSNGGSSTGAN